MEVNVDVEKTINNDGLNIEQSQKKFIETNLGKTIDTGLNIGLRALLPNAIENTVINIKDTLMENGLKDGISKMVEDAIDIGKNIKGIVTGDFSNVDELKTTLVSGGVMDGVSGLLDMSIDNIKANSKVTETMIDVVKEGKEYLFSSISQSVEQGFKDQIKAISNIEKSITNWETSFEKQDIAGVEKAFNTIQTELNGILPIKDLILKTEEINNIQQILNNNGNDFNLSESQLSMAKKMAG